MNTNEWFIEDGGIPLHLKLSRPDDKDSGKLVLVFHGFTGHMEEPHLVALTEKLVGSGYSVLRADLYGHGESGGEFKDHTILKWLENAEAVTACAEQLDGVSELYLCGHSQGGLMALLFAAENPGRFNGIILLAPGISIPDDVRRGNFLGETFDPENIPDEITTWEGLTIKGEYLRTMMDVDPYAVARCILTPTLVIHGSEDEVIPVDYAHRLVKELPAGESCIIPLGDHCFDLLHEPMADAAVSFLNWL